MRRRECSNSDWSLTSTGAASKKFTNAAHRRPSHPFPPEIVYRGRIIIIIIITTVAADRNKTSTLYS